MIVVNNTIGTIVLPTRHKLHPGQGVDLAESVLAHRKNVGFVELLKRAGKVSVLEAVSATAEQNVSVLVPKRPVPPDLPQSRIHLAKIREGELFAAAERLGMDMEKARAMQTDDLRVEIAERLFG